MKRKKHLNQTDELITIVGTAAYLAKAANDRPDKGIYNSTLKYLKLQVKQLKAIK